MNVSFDQLTAVTAGGARLRFVHMGDPGHPNDGCGGCVFAEGARSCSPCRMSLDRVCVSSDRRDKRPGGIWILA